ncbi:uncharacterized protein BCR38DRAFT_485052 [Pseudomassariella vexata]|uniref:Uncharacterized protein n=1 Tax=Pseudomassariella vexata TaxID=1141098 RepID=A0A1Y2DXR0_9PEZI|nr:uncharacterized protein BCR38DRAFT_485052 [Pseudomassariella vexata]ORY63904.1 hypothetical protein BCR38DRAFT_485052 [Pseudomassariella vexata]
MTSPMPTETEEDREAMYRMYIKNFAEPLYQKQTQDGDPAETFTNKTELIAERFANFHKNVKEGGRIPYLKKEWIGVVFAENTMVRLVSNHASFDVIQYREKPSRSGMSMIHIFGIPNDKMWTPFNAVALDKGNLDVIKAGGVITDVGIIDEMIQLFKASWEDPNVRQSILVHQLEAIEARTKEQIKASEETKLMEDYEKELDIKEARLQARIAKEHCEVLAADIDKIDVDQFQYGLHLDPDQSVHSLHLHIILAAKKYRQYSTTAHDNKTMDAGEV